MDKEPVGLPVDAPPPPVQGGEGHEHQLQEDEGAEGEPRRTSLWGPCECCISCVSISLYQNLTTELTDQLVTEYFHNENFEGVGQGQSSTYQRVLCDCGSYVDHLICLNRLNANTGPDWVENALRKLSARILVEQDGSISRRIPLQIWWGWLDGMVPRKGQCRSLMKSLSRC